MSNVRRRKDIVTTTEDLHTLEREFGFSYPTSFCEGLPELMALCETAPFATAFPATHLLLSAFQVKLVQEKCDDSLLPFMLSKEVPEDIYAFDLQSQGPEYNVVVWAVHTTVHRWSGFTEFLFWLRQQGLR